MKSLGTKTDTEINLVLRLKNDCFQLQKINPWKLDTIFFSKWNLEAFYNLDRFKDRIRFFFPVNII